MKDPFNIPSKEAAVRARRSLEWEESVVDNISEVEGFHDEARVAPAFRWLKFLVFGVALLLLGRMFHLQVMQGQEFKVLAEGNRIRKQVVLAPRGLIYDRYGKVLAQNTVSFNLIAVPFDLPKEGLYEQVASVAGVLNLNKDELLAKLQNINRASFDPILLVPDLTQEQSILFATRSAEFIGFQVQTIPVREYPSPLVFSHILGYASVISDTELERLKAEQYDHSDFIGKAGIEVVYEKYLRGTNGQDLIEVDASGKLRQLLGKVDPVAGNVAYLNIDRELQEFAAKSFEGKALGSVVVLNPKTGAVLSLVSVPGYDNNQFAHGIRQGEYQALLNDKHLPLFNRAIAGQYPPGSTVKPMVALAALEEGSITERTIIADRGVLVIPNQFNPAISYRFRGWNLQGLGSLAVREAVARSSDIFFYTVGGGHPDSPYVNPLGITKLSQWYDRFNVGKLTEIDLPSEQRGVLADPAWKSQYYKNDAILSKWYLGDTYHVAIGQGDMLTTPLQVANWTAVIANGGKSYKPRVLQKIVDQQGNIRYAPEPEVLVDIKASEKNIKIAQESMRETVVYGSAKQLNTLPITSAGKTGTSQFDGADLSRTHAWFTCYAPYEDPEIVVTVLVEAGGEGHAAAEPIAREILQWWVTNRYKK